MNMDMNEVRCRRILDVLLVRFTQGCWMGMGAAGIIIHDYYGSFPHSLSTSKSKSLYHSIESWLDLFGIPLLDHEIIPNILGSKNPRTNHQPTIIYQLHPVISSHII